MRFPIGEGDIVCIDWDERSLRVVEAGVSRGGIKIRAAACVPVTTPPDGPAALGEFLRRTLAEHRIRARRAFVSVPRQDALLNLLSLPKGSQDELAAMVHIQIAKDLPFAKDQTVIDFAVAPRKDDPNSLDVWVAAVRNNVLDSYRQVIQAAGLRLERVGLRPYANLAALNAGAEQAGRTLFVDIGPSMTEIDLVRDGQLAYSRSATVGIPAGSQAAFGSAVMDSLLVEVNRTLAAYRSTDPAARIDRIVLAGTATFDPAVVRAFQERFGAPTAVFDVPPALKWRTDKEAGPAPFSAALGLAVSNVAESLQCFNLLAPKEPEGERRERIRQVPYKAAIIAGLCAVSAAGAYYPLFQRQREIDKVQVQINALNTDKPARDELSRFLGDVDTWQAGSGFWIDHLRRFAQVFPSTEQAYISKIDFLDSGELKLEIQAKDEFQASKIAQAVNEIKDGKGVPLYSAKTVGAAVAAQDPNYSKTDHVNIQVLALVPKDTKRR